MSNDEPPTLPYGGDTHPNSGHAGSDTSRVRAIREDSDGTTGGRQAEVIRALILAGERGLTWKELASPFTPGRVGNEWHHGQVSGPLSTLHKVGRVARLSVHRGGSKVYVLPAYVNGRQTESQGQTATTALLDDMAALLVRVEREPHHHHGGLPEPGCLWCDISEALSHYENRGGRNG